VNDKPEPNLPAWALPVLSWLVACYFLLGFVVNVGFPPRGELLVGHALLVLLFLFFLFLPFFTRIKIGKFLELEREVAKAKEELQEFKAEVRNSMSVLSTNVNTIGGMTNQVTVNIPGLAELREARQVIEQEAPKEAKETAGQVEERIIRQSEDTTLAMARTRFDIERLLRRILGKRTSIPPGKEETLKFASVGQLFDLFISQNQQLAYLKKPFRYVTQIGNAAIHAQRVSDDQATEALALGAQIIAVLREFSDEGD
jgi:hypothetical protein